MYLTQGIIVCYHLGGMYFLKNSKMKILLAIMFPIFFKCQKFNCSRVKIGIASQQCPCDYYYLKIIFHHLRQNDIITNM